VEAKGTARWRSRGQLSGVETKREEDTETNTEKEDGEMR